VIRTSKCCTGDESINRHLDDTLWLRRAHSVGNRRQLLNMITYALGVTALSMHVRRQGLAPPSEDPVPRCYTPTVILRDAGCQPIARNNDRL
jgi:hypothetical protein